nr:16S rRNA (uracil(1498)-N(3))-methyltransferase [Flavisolibacter sp.]
MSVPFIYFPFPLEKTVTLDEDASRHLVQVLRMQKDAAVLLTDGKGTKAHGFIKDDHRKKTVLEIVQVEKVVPRIKQISIAISLVKNTARFEWFLEKATELGVSSIIPLLCERTEKEKFRFDRLKGIIVSAMLQSQQVWLPELIAPVDFKSFINSSQQYQRKYIAHCLLGDKKEINTRQ